MAGVSYAEGRAQTMLFSDLPMGEEKYYLYANLAAADISVSDLTTLNGKRIGMLPESIPTTQFCEWETRHGLNTEHVTITSGEDAAAKKSTVLSRSRAPSGRNTACLRSPRSAARMFTS